GPRAAEVHPRVAMVVDLDLGPEAEVLVLALGAVQHGSLSRSHDGPVDDLPLAGPPASRRGPAAERLAVEEGDPLARQGRARCDPDQGDPQHAVAEEPLESIHGW